MSEASWHNALQDLKADLKALEAMAERLGRIKSHDKLLTIFAVRAKLQQALRVAVMDEYLKLEDGLNKAIKKIVAIQDIQIDYDYIRKEAYISSKKRLFLTDEMQNSLRRLGFACATVGYFNKERTYNLE